MARWKNRYARNRARREFGRYFDNNFGKNAQKATQITIVDIVVWGFLFLIWIAIIT